MPTLIATSLCTLRLPPPHKAAASGRFSESQACMLALCPSSTACLPLTPRLLPRVSHSELVSAYRHLCQPPCDPATNPCIIKEAAEAYNRAAVAAYNQELQRLQAPAQAAALAACGAAGGADAAAPGASEVAPPRATPAPPAPGPALPSAAWPEDAKLRKARALAALGLPALCCAWGKAQEAASLRAVLGIFPACRLLEVGAGHLP